MLLVFDLDISEFVNKIKNFFTKELLESLQDCCITMYTNIFEQANTATENAASQLMVTPENMFPGVYKTIVGISETVFFPLAGIILVCILSYECVSMLTESNRMRDFGPPDVFILIIKLLLGIMLLTHSMDIVNACFKLGQWAVEKAGMESVNANLGEGLDAISLIEQSTDVLSMIGYLFVGVIVKVGIVIFSVIVKVAVWLRFVELYMFIVSSPIPFATFLNKEWGQIGQNYLRKILSLAFQPIYMIICFSIFSGTLILQTDEGFTWALIKSLAAMVVLSIALFKTGSIADSIFNAH